MKLYELLLEIGGTKAPVNWQQTNNSYTGTFIYNDRLYRIDVRNIMLEPSDFKYLQIPDHSHLIIYNIGFGAWDEASNKMSLNLTNQHSAIKIFSIVQNAVIQLFIDKHIIPDIEGGMDADDPPGRLRNEMEQRTRGQFNNHRRLFFV